MVTIDLDSEIAERLRERAADARMTLDEYLSAVAEAEGLVPVSAEFETLIGEIIEEYGPLLKRLAQ